MNVIGAQHLEFVQTDQNVAAQNAGVLGGTVGANVRNR